MNPENFFVIIRGERSGVFAGNLESLDGRKVVLSEPSRLWKVPEHTSIGKLATEGVRHPKRCIRYANGRQITITDVRELAFATETAETCIKEMPIGGGNDVI